MKALVAKANEQEVLPAATWENMGRNRVLGSGGEFYISYNPNTGGMFGGFFAGDGDGEETALCIKRETGENLYLILNGDFRDEYEKAFTKGLEACRAVYEKHKAKHDSSWTTNRD